MECTNYLSLAVLHPRHKIRYFKEAGWSSEWIETARQLVEDVYNNSYASRHASAVLSKDKDIDTGVEDNVRTNLQNRSSMYAKWSRQQKPRPSESENIFDNLPSLAKAKPKQSHSELDAYLAADVVNITDALTWWTEHREIYPQLSRMATDYLSIPGTLSQHPYVDSIDIFVATSVDVERLFSRGRVLLAHVRNRLCAQTIRALLCLGSWSRLGLVKDADIKKVTIMDDVEGEEEVVFLDGWDAIDIE